MEVLVDDRPIGCQVKLGPENLGPLANHRAIRSCLSALHGGDPYYLDHMRDRLSTLSCIILNDGVVPWCVNFSLCLIIGLCGYFSNGPQGEVARLPLQRSGRGRMNHRCKTCSNSHRLMTHGPSTKPSCGG